MISAMEIRPGRPLFVNFYVMELEDRILGRGRL